MNHGNNRKHGKFKSVSGTNPVAGAEVSFTVPQGKVWIPHSLVVVLVTAAGGAARDVSLEYARGDSIFWRGKTWGNQAASLTRTHSWAHNNSFINVDADVLSGILLNEPLFEGTIIRTKTASIAGGDDFGQPVIYIEEFDIKEWKD